MHFKAQRINFNVIKCYNPVIDLQRVQKVRSHYNKQAAAHVSVTVWRWQCLSFSSMGISLPFSCQLLSLHSDVSIRSQCTRTLYNKWKCQRGKQRLWGSGKSCNTVIQRVNKSLQLITVHMLSMYNKLHACIFLGGETLHLHTSLNGRVFVNKDESAADMNR